MLNLSFNPTKPSVSSPRFSGIEVRQPNQHAVQFVIVPNDSFKGINYKSETKSSRLADEVNEGGIADFYSQALYHSDGFNATFKNILKEAPIPPNLKKQLVKILDSSHPQREITLHNNGQTWHSVVTYSKKPNWFRSLFSQ
jgi:hypothetical protein